MTQDRICMLTRYLVSMGHEVEHIEQGVFPLCNLLNTFLPKYFFFSIKYLPPFGDNRCINLIASEGVNMDEEMKRWKPSRPIL